MNSLYIVSVYVCVKATNRCSPETAHGLLVFMTDGSSNNYYITKSCRIYFRRITYTYYGFLLQINSTFLSDILVLWLYVQYCWNVVYQSYKWHSLCG